MSLFFVLDLPGWQTYFRFSGLFPYTPRFYLIALYSPSLPCNTSPTSSPVCIPISFHWSPPASIESKSPPNHSFPTRLAETLSHPLPYYSIPPIYFPFQRCIHCQSRRPSFVPATFSSITTSQLTDVFSIFLSCLLNLVLCTPIFHCLLSFVLPAKLGTTEFPRQRGFHCQLSCWSCFPRFRWFFSLSTSCSRFQTVDRRVSSPTRLPLSTFLPVVFFLLLLVLLTVDLEFLFPNYRSRSFLANAASTVNFLAGRVLLAFGGSSHCRPHVLVSKLSIAEFPRQRGFHCQLACWSCFPRFWCSFLTASRSRF